MKIYIRNSILFLCFNLYSFTAYAQNKTIDSLQKVLLTEKEDSNKVNTLLKLCEEFDVISDEKDIILTASEALSIAEKLNFEIGTAKAYSYISLAYANNGDLTNAFDYISKALVLFQKEGNKVLEAQSYRMIAFIYQRQTNYPEDIKNMYLSLKLFEELGNKKGIATSLRWLGVAYEYQKNYDEALENYLASLKICEEIGDKGLLNDSYGSIAEVKALQGDYPEAMKYDSLSLRISEDLNDKFNIGACYLLFGEVYQKLGDINKNKKNKAAFNYYTAAKENVLRALKLWEESIINASNSGVIYEHLGEISLGLNNLKEAKIYLQKSLQFAKESTDKENFAGVYNGFTQLDSAQGNLGQALGDYKMYIVYRDSINNDETAKKSLQLKMQYDSDKKEALAKAEEEKQQAVEQRKENLEYLAIVSLIILVLAFLFIATRTHVPLKWIDITGFVGVLLFFQFLETLLHPYVTQYTHGNPLYFMGVNIALASSIKPLHHTIEKRLISISHNTTEKRRLKKLQHEKEKRRKAAEESKQNEGSEE